MLEQNMINTEFDTRSDANGKDPDSHSPTLRKYHRLLWSKPLPNGDFFNLKEGQGAEYLKYESNGGVIVLGSDAITHSYRNQKRKSWIIEQIPDEVESLFHEACKIGSYVVFPKNKIDGFQTINQIRGINRYIDDRFDLTLECIRRYYLDYPSPIHDTLKRYKGFFDLFIDFKGYVEFFLLQDLIHKQTGEINFYLPFDGFQSTFKFGSVQDYLIYKRNALEFLKKRSERISNFAIHNN